MLTSRLLPPEEWAALDETEAAVLWRDLDPAQTRVVVVEEDGRLVGCWLALQVLHAECVWVHPAHRGAPGIARRLVQGMFQVARAARAKVIYTSAMTAEVRGLIAKLQGSQLPGTAHVIPVPEAPAEEAPCPQP